MPKLEISAAEIEKHYETLSKIGNLGPTPESGYLRAAYSDEESAAIAYIAKKAEALGMSVRYDAVGNLAAERIGASGRFVEVGSHLDTVPMGGNFDGAAGVVAGLAAIEALSNSGVELESGVRLRVWRGEESSTFNSVYTGSLAAFGKLSPALLENRFGGRTLRDAIISQGYDPSVIERGAATISGAEIDSIRAHLELHIEQGNLLEVSGKEIGVVTSIRGPRRSRVILEGEFDHSGATPMGTAFRKDVNLAIGYTLVALDNLANQHIAQGRDLVQTVGVINSDRAFNEREPGVYQNAVPKVSGYGYFCLDIRSNDNAFREAYCKEAEQLIIETTNRLGVKARVDLISSSSALESMDGDVRAVLGRAASSLGISSEEMPSGAGHDAAVVGAQKQSGGGSVPVGMVFIPCRGGKSHCPEEYASFESIAKGAMVLAGAIYELAGKS